MLSHVTLKKIFELNSCRKKLAHIKVLPQLVVVLIFEIPAIVVIVVIAILLPVSFSWIVSVALMGLAEEPQNLLKRYLAMFPVPT